MESTEGGNAKAQNNLGFMYTYGIGTQMDYSKAKNYLNMAVAQGYSQAQVGLGSLYRAQFNLGLMYYFGKGGNKNYAMAKSLFQQASAQGHNYAMKFLLKVEDKEQVVETDSIFDLKIKAK